MVVRSVNMFACFSPKDVNSMRAGTMSTLPIAGSQQKRHHQHLLREIINGRKNMQIVPILFKKLYLCIWNLLYKSLTSGPGRTRDDFFSFCYCVFCLFWLLCTACGILVPILGIKPAPPVMEAWGLNHWSAREVPRDDLYFVLYELVCFKTQFIIRPNKTNMALWKKRTKWIN